MRCRLQSQEWVVAANNLAQFAVSTHPQVIPNSVLPNYYKYVTDFDKDMKRNGVDSSKQVLSLFLDDLLRLDWATNLSPECHLFDYKTHQHVPGSRRALLRQRLWLLCHWRFLLSPFV